MMVDDTQFTIRCYRKSELALLYFPELNPESALKKLRRWICKCTPLRNEIEENGSSLTMRSFTAKEVRLIVYHLGEPF